MEERTRTYLAIDLKSFYASVECVERGLDPLNTNLVVADESRTNKTICLAVSPALKSFGVPGRPRLFEVEQIVGRENDARARRAPGRKLAGSSVYADELNANPALGIDYLVAVPRMAFYLDYSTRIFDIYRSYVSPEDIHVYSVDEVFIDVTNYLRYYDKTGHQLAMTMIKDVLKQTGITATAGVGTNMYLAKVAMDIVAKHMPADKDGVRIAELDEMSYRRELWTHEPITDFWRVGKGYARRLAKHGVRTMGDVARLSVVDEDVLYREFGINAELLIDHAWGWEPARIRDIKAYLPSSKSLSSGQVLMEPYPYEKARIIVREMADSLALEMVGKGYATDGVTLLVNYDVSSDLSEYDGEMATDWYGREAAKPALGTETLRGYTVSAREITDAALAIFDAQVDRKLLVRKLNVAVIRLVPRDEAANVRDDAPVQLDLFGEVEAREKADELARAEHARDASIEDALIDIKSKFGKNAVIKGTSLQDGATGRDRNRQIGGHRG